jgi:hypothetical protein
MNVTVVIVGLPETVDSSRHHLHPPRDIMRTYLKQQNSINIL